MDRTEPIGGSHWPLRNEGPSREEKMKERRGPQISVSTMIKSIIRS